jgi:hypothetical protein
MREPKSATKEAREQIVVYLLPSDAKRLRHHCVDVDGKLTTEIERAILAMLDKPAPKAKPKPAPVKVRDGARMAAENVANDIKRLREALEFTGKAQSDFDRYAGVSKGTTRNALAGVVDVATVFMEVDKFVSAVGGDSHWATLI